MLMAGVAHGLKGQEKQKYPQVHFSKEKVLLVFVSSLAFVSLNLLFTSAYTSEFFFFSGTPSVSLQLGMVE